MRKVIIYWWIRSEGGRKQGHDIIKVDNEEFDITDAENLIDSDLQRDIPIGSGKMPSGFRSQNKPTNLPVFYQAHKDLSLCSRHSEISNWGIRKVSFVPKTSQLEEKKP